MYIYEIWAEVSNQPILKSTYGCKELNKIVSTDINNG